ncbi:PAS domain S-box protein [Sphingobium agri]|uniref:histidine kinase n=1 Tax=Sphingobium agri TaxID=2933566 RepID=A0ABT0DZF1_9SPHN|nr:PAS domain S-box protein [Sphingobium agri]MCK0532507.1 PAS domain S-box protein [Sphingobium agri]
MTHLVDENMSSDAAVVFQHFFELSVDMLATASSDDGTWRSVNPAFERILGWSKSDLIGHLIAPLVHPDDLERTQAASADLDRGASLFEFEHRLRCKDGSYRWISWHAAVREADGLAYCIGRDVTARRAAEERQAFLLNLSEGLRDLAEPVEVQKFAQRLLGEYLGATRVGYAGDVGDGVPAQISIIEETAQRTLIAVERARAETALRRSELKYRDLFNSMDEGYCIIQILYEAGRPVDWRFLEVNPAFEKHNGLGNAVGRTMRELQPAIEPKWVDIYAHVAETGESLRFEEDSQALNGRTFNLFAFQVGNPDDKTVAVLFQDITEQRRSEKELRESEDRLRVLVAELQHRVRNMLTVVRSMFASTAETSENIDHLVDHFVGRLDALARTQVIVTSSVDQTVDLENLIRDELLSVGVHDGPAVEIEGPDVALSSKIGETLGLAFHELTTNALKYGALKAPNGRLNISWHVEMDDGGASKLHLCWAERGVPAISVNPSRQGFGRELIEDALAYRLDAETRLEFRSGGVRWSISLPLAG